jgi:hypothetical protein
MGFQVIIPAVSYISGGADEAPISCLIHPDKPDTAHPRQSRTGDLYFSMAFGRFQ